MYVVYSKDNCSYCTKAKQLLKDKELEHQIINIVLTEDQISEEGSFILREDFIKQFPHIKTVPHIIDISDNKEYDYTSLAEKLLG